MSLFGVNKLLNGEKSAKIIRSIYKLRKDKMETIGKYHIITYGCQMNLHESEKMAGILEKGGYEKAENMEDADVILFNTCCIRENAENHAFGNIGALKKLKRERPGLIIAVGGCMTQEKGKAEYLREKFPFIDVIFGNLNLEQIGELVEQKRKQKKKIVSLREKEGEVIEYDPPVRNSYPNAWVNIMYGCNNFCSYCIVPYVRGRERSRKPEHIIAECENLIKEGYREITLLGQNVNSYGNDGATDMRFPELLERVARLDGDFRVRFMTSHPKDFSEELVKVIARNRKICHQIHLPVQSGNDRVLKEMNRRYTSADYLAKVRMLREYLPDAEITSDLIVGFPGETDEEFKDTVRLAQEVDFSSAFTFVYSKRSGTRAAEMPDQIPEEVQKERIMELVEVINRLTREKSAKYVGRETEILCEDYDPKRNLYFGRDEYGRMGYFESEENCIGKFVMLKVDAANGVSLFGKKLSVR